MKIKGKWFYKGRRVHKFYRRFLWKAAAGIVLFSVVLFFVIFGLKSGFQYELPDLILSLGGGFLASLALSVVFYFTGVWQNLYNLEKLCRMCFDAVYYNLEGKSRQGKIRTSEKKMTYFPRVYYRNRKGKIEITFRLDGSRCHERFLYMTDHLSAMFDMEVTEAKRRTWYMVYTLEDVSKSRLYLGKDEIVYGKNEIPLMKGISWNFKRAPHALVTGITGGGKSFFLQYLINSLETMDVSIKIIDPKRADLYNLHNLLGDENVAYAAGRIMRLLREAVEEMEERYAGMEGKPFGTDYESMGFQPQFIIFDEFVAFIQTVDRAEERKKLLGYLAQIVLKGRQAGVFLIFATQRADASCLPGAIRDNLGLRVSLGALEMVGYRMTFGDVDRSLEKFGPGHGYVFISGVTGTVREFYAPFFTEGYDPVKELEEIVKKQADSPDKLRSSLSGSEKGESA